MNPIASMHAFRLFVMLLLTLALAGCGTALHKVVREEPAAPGGYVDVDAAAAAGHVRVTRGGQTLALHLPLALQPGDVIETAPASGAVIRLERGEAVLGPETRVRMGSLEVIFGRIFASVRGLFRAEDGNVAADVEGTRFAFESQRGGATRVVVLDGVVRCSPKLGGWTPVRVSAGHSLSLAGSAQPSLTVTSPAEREEIRRWTEAVTNAPRAGYCCADGRVFPTLSNACRGRFESSEDEARRQCAPGWCCRHGDVRQSVRAECAGSFHSDRRAAERACVPAPGWCCGNGEVWQTSREQCRGSFHGDRRAADKACAPAPPPSPAGWCCVEGGRQGKVWQTDKAECDRHRGHLHTSRRSAEGQCAGTVIR